MDYRLRNELVERLINHYYVNFNIRYGSNSFFVTIKDEYLEGVDFNITTSGQNIYPELEIDVKDDSFTANFGLTDFEKEIDLDQAFEWCNMFGIKAK